MTLPPQLPTNCRTLHVLQITAFLRSDAGLDAVATGKFNATGLRLVTALPATLSSLDKKVDDLADEINVAVRSSLSKASVAVGFIWRSRTRYHQM